MDKQSETPSADQRNENLHHDPLLTMAHDSWSQHDISNSPDIAQHLFVNNSTMHKDTKHMLGSIDNMSLPLQTNS